MIGDTPEPPAPVDPGDPAHWSDKRKAYEALKAEQNKRGAELLANYARPRPVVVRGRHRVLKRARR
jgi:hypothetical protein